MGFKNLIKIMDHTDGAAAFFESIFLTQLANFCTKSSACAGNYQYSAGSLVRSQGGFIMKLNLQIPSNDILDIPEKIDKDVFDFKLQIDREIAA